LENRRECGTLPSGKAIADRFEHKEHWGMLTKQWRRQGRLERIDAGPGTNETCQVSTTSPNTTRNSVVRAGETMSVDQDMNTNEVPQTSPKST